MCRRTYDNFSRTVAAAQEASEKAQFWIPPEERFGQTRSDLNDFFLNDGNKNLRSLHMFENDPHLLQKLLR